MGGLCSSRVYITENYTNFILIDDSYVLCVYVCYLALEGFSSLRIRLDQVQTASQVGREVPHKQELLLP